MTSMWLVTRRELASLFRSPVGYVAAAAALLIRLTARAFLIGHDAPDRGQDF